MHCAQRRVHWRRLIVGDDLLLTMLTATQHKTVTVLVDFSLQRIHIGMRFGL